MSAPLISVVIPAFNASAFIEETLTAVEAQTYRPLEIVVADDGSTDDTLERVARFGSAVRCLRLDHAGSGAARRAGQAATSGTYLAFLDADDVWLPETLEAQVDVARRHPDSGLVVCDGIAFEGARVIWESLLGGPIGERLARSGAESLTGRFYRDLIAETTISTPGQTLIPRAVADRVGPVSADPAISQDWEYHLRIAARYPLTFHRRQLVRYRCHSTSASGPMELRSYRWILRDLPVFEQQLRECAPADRGAVRLARRVRTRRQARQAYYHGRREDLAFARGFLRRLLRQRPTDPVVLAWALAVHLPEGVAAPLGRLLRAIEAR